MDFYSYVGIPFTEKGYTRLGCNCWGLIRLWLIEQRGYNIPSYEDYYSDTNDSKGAKKILKSSSSSGDWLKVDTEEPGDVVLLRIKNMPWHVGIVAPKKKMLHIERGLDSIIEPYKGLKWRNRILGFYRYR